MGRGPGHGGMAGQGQDEHPDPQRHDPGLLLRRVRRGLRRSVPGDDPIVKTLLSVYEKQTGKKGHEVIIGGGTYGRLFKHGVAFGAQPEGAPLVMHQPNEYMKVDDLINSIAIYAEAIYELTK